MKFYVAGKWQDRELIREIMDKLEAMGHEITVDWTRHEYPDNEDVLSIWATLDIHGVQTCDTFVVLFINGHRFRGALVEVGAALAMHKRVCVIGNDEDSCIFLKHPLVKKFGQVSSFLQHAEEMK